MGGVESRESLLNRLSDLSNKLHSVADDLVGGKLKAKEANLAVRAYNQEINVIMMLLKYSKTGGEAEK